MYTTTTHKKIFKENFFFFENWYKRVEKCNKRTYTRSCSKVTSGFYLANFNATQVTSLLAITKNFKLNFHQMYRPMYRMYRFDMYVFITYLKAYTHFIKFSNSRLGTKESSVISFIKSLTFVWEKYNFFSYSILRQFFF